MNTGTDTKDTDMILTGTRPTGTDTDSLDAPAFVLFTVRTYSDGYTGQLIRHNVIWSSEDAVYDFLARLTENMDHESGALHFLIAEYAPIPF